MSETNAFEEMEKQLRRERQEVKGREVMDSAGTRLIMGRVAGVQPVASVFFSTLLLKLKIRPDWEVKTMQVDGETILYNPEFVCKLADLDQTCGVLAHEVMHCCLLHHARREHRKEEQWQIATDFVVNEYLRQAGFKLPITALYAGEGEYQKLPKGKTEEEYYDLLQKKGKKKKEDKDGECGAAAGGQPGGQAAGDGAGDGDGKGQGSGKGGTGKGQPDPGGCGTCTEPKGNGAGKAQSAAEWRAGVAEAGQAAEREAVRSRGDAPAWMKRLVGQATRPKVSWKEVLREFMTRYACNDYDWSRPNSRIMAACDVYLPRLRSPDLGQVLVFVDTSGSIGPKMLDLFAGELQGILDDFASVELKIAYHDAGVHEEANQDWTPDLGPLKLEPVGGGGTDHRPCFAYLDEHPEIEPSCIICLTDGLSVFPDNPPACPVLWALVGNYTPNIPWGQTVQVEE